MTRRARNTAATFGRYLTFQLPGLVIAAGVLALLVHYEQISDPIAYGLFALWVAGEIALFPVMRIGYETGVSHTGIEAMIGASGAAVEDLDPDGHVRVGAERWRAVSRRGPIAAGSPVRVLDVRDLTLVVEQLTGEIDPPGAIRNRRDD